MSAPTDGYRLDSGKILDLHPEGIRLAHNVHQMFFRVHPEEAMARAIQTYLDFLKKYTDEERRRDDARMLDNAKP